MTLELSETHLKQALSSLRQLPSYDGSTENLSSFIRRVDYILNLYPTRDARQHNILFGAIEMQLSGDAQRISQLSESNNWPELKTALINELKTQTPCEELLRRLYNTNYNGNLRKFIEELENKSYIITNKLSLENNAASTILYTNAMKNTIKEVITRKLPDRLFMTLARFDITTVTNLKQVAQREGLYENNTEIKKSNQSQQSGKSAKYFPQSIGSSANTSQTNQAGQQPKPDNNPPSFKEFQQKLNQGRVQNPLNYQTHRYSNFQENPPNQPMKRQRESNSGISRMDTSENFHQEASEQEESESETEIHSLE